MSHTRKTPPIKYATANLPTDVDAGTMALDTTTNEQKVFNGTAWEVVEGEFIGTPTIVFDSTGPAYDQIQGDIPSNWKDTDTSLKGLVIGTSCELIGTVAFRDCTGLTGSLVIPDSVKIIDNYAFEGCTNLTGVRFGSSLSQIRISSFLNCTGLTGTLVIPDGVVQIKEFAFKSCTGLTKVIIPNSVTTNIGGPVIGETFANCSGLSTIDCYIEKNLLDRFNNLLNSGVTTIHVRSTDTTWTAGGGQTIGGKTGITVIKDL